MIECGFLTNPTDAAFIANSEGQEKVAKDILDAINNYAASNYSDNAPKIDNNDAKPAGIKKANDTIPEMYYKGKKLRNISVQSNSKNIKVTESVIKVSYDDGSTEMISKEESDRRGFILPPPPPGLPPSYFESNALFIIDGKISTNEKAKALDSKNIKSIDVLKDKHATDKYGAKGKNGVIEITTKNGDDLTLIADTIRIGRDSSAKPFLQNVNLRSKAIYINSKIPNGVLIFADGKEISEDEMKKIESTNIQSIDILKGENAIKKYGNKGKEGAIEITTKNNIPANTLMIIDGKESTRDDLEKITPTNIESITVLKREGAIKKYGNKAKDGSIEIITKKNSTMRSVIDTIPGKIFTKVEEDAQFPGGPAAWQKYITRAIVASIDTFTEKDFGTCVVRFIVDQNGKVSDVKATTMQGTMLASISVNTIMKGPNWIPAKQNGHTVASYRLQPVTLANPTKKTEPPAKNSTTKFAPPTVKKDDENVSIILGKAASFPDGQSGWLKYISQAIQKNGNELIADKSSEGVCKVRFIVTKEGKVSDVQAITKQGTKLADVAVNAIKRGPSWNPGIRSIVSPTEV
jgi:TonB-dependent SusC/RagA subfamily outer membrane receptor